MDTILLFSEVGLLESKHTRKCVVPEGLAKEPPKMLKLPRCVVSIGFTMDLARLYCFRLQWLLPKLERLSSIGLSELNKQAFVFQTAMKTDINTRVESFNLISEELDGILKPRSMLLTKHRPELLLPATFY